MTTQTSDLALTPVRVDELKCPQCGKQYADGTNGPHFFAKHVAACKGREARAAWSNARRRTEFAAVAAREAAALLAPFGIDVAEVSNVPAARRLFRKIHLAPTGCWEWMAARTAGGWGAATMLDGSGRTTSAHRVVYELLHGPVPADLELDHLCKNRPCVNPAHLEPVTPAENARRCDAPSHVVRRTGICMRGHVKDEANTWRSKEGYARCRACDAAAYRARAGRRREAVA